MFWAIYLAVFFAGLAMMVREGLWSNTISLVNILISGLVAFGFYSPLAIYLDEMFNGQYTYLLDFVVIWVLFVVTMVICRALTGAGLENADAIQVPDRSGRRTARGLIAAWVLAAFVMATLHTSPMPKDAFGGKLVIATADVESASALRLPTRPGCDSWKRCRTPTALRLTRHRTLLEPRLRANLCRPPREI